MARSRPVVSTVVAFALLQGGVGTVSAHGIGTGEGVVGLPLVVGTAVGLAAVAGLVAAVGGERLADDGSGWLVSLVGPLLVVLGGVAALTATKAAVLVAGVCLLVGAVLAWALVGHVGHGHVHDACATTTLGAVAVHRTVEGIALAAVYATGSALGLVGALVLAGHATAETVAVGSLFGARRRRAVLAVVAVQVAFLAGATAGLAATTGLPPVLSNGTLALVAGVLLVVGAVETRRHGLRIPDRS